MSSTLTRSGLTEALYKSIGLSRNESSELVELVLEELLLSFEREENVKLTAFGTFKLRKFEISKLYPNVEKARNKINWRSKILFEKGLRKTIDSYK